MGLIIIVAIFCSVLFVLTLVLSSEIEKLKKEIHTIKYPTEK